MENLSQWIQLQWGKKSAYVCHQVKENMDISSVHLFFGGGDYTVYDVKIQICTYLLHHVLNLVYGRVVAHRLQHCAQLLHNLLHQN